MHIKALSEMSSSIKTSSSPPKKKSIYPTILTKCSPNVVTHKTNEDMFHFEAKLWDETFESMGGIYRLMLANQCPEDNTPAASQCQGMRARPYHCPSLAGRVFRQSCAVADLKPHHQTPHRRLNIHLVSAIERMPKTNKQAEMPPLSRWPSDPLCKPRRPSASPTLCQVYEMPLTCVMVTWGPVSGFTEDALYHWLEEFGEILFKIPGGDAHLTRMYVTFDSLVAAHRAVNAHKIPAAVSVTWVHRKLYNFGQLKPVLGYTLSTDPKWMDIIHQSRTEAMRKRKTICNDITIAPEQKIGCPKPK